MDSIRVLLVEDNPGDADLTRESLEIARIHVELDVAIDGEMAVQMLHREPPYANFSLPDLILLDLNLPKLDGREVLAKIKADPVLRVIPVIVLSSSEAERDIEEIYALGANCYVSKPLDLAAFQKALVSLKDFWFTIVRLPSPDAT